MRHMKQARRIDNGELVQGYFVPFDGATKISKGNRYCIINGMYAKDIYEVDPATVEDVAVKPIFNGGIFHFCPTCVEINDTISCDYLVDPKKAYCRRCGQRLDWSGEDAK